MTDYIQIAMITNQSDHIKKLRYIMSQEREHSCPDRFRVSYHSVYKVLHLEARVLVLRVFVVVVASSRAFPFMVGCVSVCISVHICDLDVCVSPSMPC